MNSLENVDFGLSISDRRRAFFDRAVSKSRTSGTPTDGDRRFVQLITAWIDGKVEMAGVALAYAEVRLAGAKQSQQGQIDPRNPIKPGDDPIVRRQRHA
jgi:hypothetical protein